MTLAALLQAILMLMEPGVLEGIIEQGIIIGLAQITPETLLSGAIERLVPLVMAFLTLTLKDSINRWANIIAGIFYTALSVISMTYGLTFPAGIMLWVSAAVSTALIVWYAWKSK